MSVSICALYIGLVVCVYARMKTMMARRMLVLSKAVTLESLSSVDMRCKIARLFCAASMQILLMRSNQIFLLPVRVLYLITRYNKNGLVSRIVVPQ